MKIPLLVPIILSCLSVVPAWAFPPAPYYRIYGTVRNEQGRPLAAGEGNVILDGVYSGRGTASVSGGAITGVTILSSGSNYTSPPAVHFVGANGSGSGATAFRYAVMAARSLSGNRARFSWTWVMEPPTVS